MIQHLPCDVKSAQKSKSGGPKIALGEIHLRLIAKPLAKAAVPREEVVVKPRRFGVAAENIVQTIKFIFERN